MKFYSDVTQRLYNTEQELVKAETEAKEVEAKRIAAEKAKKETRAKRAKEVEDALKFANEAQAEAVRLLKDFTKDYGYFHMSYSTDDAEKKDTGKVNLDSFMDVLTSFLG